MSAAAVHHKNFLTRLGSRAMLAMLTVASISLLSGSAVLRNDDGPLHKSDLKPKLAPDEWVMLRRLHNGAPTEAQLTRGQAQHKKLLNQARTRSEQRGAGWQELGPYNIGGRVLDLAWDPNIADTFYVATASSGLWSTSNNGQSFNYLWESEFAQAIGSVAVGPTSELYVGVGEGAPSGNNPTQGLKGVFAAANLNTAWENRGLTNSFRTGRVRIDPNDATRLFVAASGPVWESGGERGIYRSTDSGVTWELVLAGLNDTSGGAEVIIDPLNSQRVFAVMWDHIRTASFRRLGGAGSGVFRSEDGGETWQRLGAGLPAQNPNVGRIGLGMSPQNPNRLYATYIDATGFFTGFYRTDDGGDNWTQLPFNQSLANSQSSFGWWFGRTWVDPFDQDNVFVAGVQLQRSSNAGQSWVAAAPTTHVDHHAMAWHPTIPGYVILGNDGGLYESTNNGSTWSRLGGQPFTQFYTVAVSQQTANRVLGGTQDNNCIRNYGSTTGLQWNAIGCGDGLEVLINPQNENDVYACSQRGFCARYSNGGNNFQFSIGPLGSRRAWKTPLVLDPTTPSTVYYGAERVYRSTNSGANFVAISPDLTEGDPIPSDNFTYGTLSTIAPASTNSEVIYTGTDDGNLWRTTDGGINWVSINSVLLPDRWVTKIAVNPTDENHLIAVFNGYQAADYTPYVFESNDAGDSWIDLTANLPQIPMNSVLFLDADRVAVAGDLGVYYRHLNGGEWQSIGLDLPTAPVMELAWQNATSTLYVATFGRGMWSMPLTISDSDQDADGVIDELDNCTLIPNPNQIDVDNDGFGNFCDPDVTNDCIVAFLDTATIAASFGMNYPLADFDSSGSVNFLDYAVMRDYFLMPPGPSGLASCGN